jgi:hypothetical protein
MSRPYGLSPRRATIIDADTVLVGYVGPATRGVAAATRTGAAQLITTNLASVNEAKAVLYGQTSNASGGYLIQAAHIPIGGAITDASGWTTLGIMSASGVGRSEMILSGKEIFDDVKAAATAALAVSASARTAAAVTLTVAAHPFLVGDYITVSGFVSAGAPFNGTYAVTSVTATTIVYSTTTTGNVADGGTAGVIYSGTSQTLTTIDPRVYGVRAIAGTGSNGAAAPAGTLTLALQPCYS